MPGTPIPPADEAPLAPADEAPPASAEGVDGDALLRDVVRLTTVTDEMTPNQAERARERAHLVGRVRLLLNYSEMLKGMSALRYSA